MCERLNFQIVVKECKDAVQEYFATGNTSPPICSNVPSWSGPVRVHYFFDFAQQVHYPHNPLQPVPMYFKIAWKCPIFGVCCERIP